ncbi:MAG: hypothetical protein WA705_19300 [Candidatus Ozemobacteraceae bacterium]
MNMKSAVLVLLAAPLLFSAAVFGGPFDDSCVVPTSNMKYQTMEALAAWRQGMDKSFLLWDTTSKASVDPIILTHLGLATVMEDFTALGKMAVGKKTKDFIALSASKKAASVNQFVEAAKIAKSTDVYDQIILKGLKFAKGEKDFELLFSLARLSVSKQQIAEEGGRTILGGWKSKKPN